MNIVALCYKMQWTWTELMDQPQWFITHLSALLRQEAEWQAKKAKNNT